MAQIVEIHEGDVLVFANVGHFPWDKLRLLLDEVSRQLGVKSFVFEDAADVSVIRRAVLEGDPDDEGGGS